MITEPDTLFPLQQFLGLQIERGDGTATASLELGDQHLNPNGVSHGAVAFTLMDTAMGAAVVSVIDDDRICATIEIHTRLLRPVSTGRLSATASVMSAGRRIVHLSADTSDDQGRLIASATGSFAVLAVPAGLERR